MRVGPAYAGDMIRIDELDDVTLHPLLSSLDEHARETLSRENFSEDDRELLGRWRRQQTMHVRISIG